jgi:peptidyl-prolyl cis-trans isomerase A (cyclophilin A)
MMMRTPLSPRTWVGFAALTGLLSLGVLAAAQQSSQQTAPQALPDAPSTEANIQPPVLPGGPTAVLDTSMGRMVCRLYSAQSPTAVANFVGLAKGSKIWTDPATHKKMQGRPYYDGTTFHRVIPGFMVQGGDPTGTGTGDPGYFFADELDPSLNFEQPGMLAMANSGPNTNGSQFFITVAPYPSLDQHYVIFGKCDDASVLVAQAITEVPRDDRDKPFQPVYLNKVTIVENGQPLPPVPSPAPTTSTTPAQATHTPTLVQRH